MNSIKIVAVAGSLRKESYTEQLVQALQELAPEEVEISTFQLGHSTN